MVTLQEDYRRCSGRFLQLKNTVNTMVDQLLSFASEATRVANELGTEGKLGGGLGLRGFRADGKI
ncbi:MAG: hypothetical protein HY730_05305 [Candidatus Tectomicrobia bacterium]|uniref:Uncharacterized protein n=1 Tax=Tectimicrobiota bacterium TaxID=2528274 RepID=A0A933GLT5_UNCTE|nr:hypothetical protein [Candidatus Tectomicrobia bacterium]